MKEQMTKLILACKKLVTLRDMNTVRDEQDNAYMIMSVAYNPDNKNLSINYQKELDSIIKTIKQIMVMEEIN